MLDTAFAALKNYKLTGTSTKLWQFITAEKNARAVTDCRLTRKKQRFLLLLHRHENTVMSSCNAMKRFVGNDTGRESRDYNLMGISCSLLPKK